MNKVLLLAVIVLVALCVALARGRTLKIDSTTTETGPRVVVSIIPAGEETGSKTGCSPTASDARPTTSPVSTEMKSQPQTESPKTSSPDQKPATTPPTAQPSATDHNTDLKTEIRKHFDDLKNAIQGFKAETDEKLARVAEDIRKLHAQVEAGRVQLANVTNELDAVKKRLNDVTTELVKEKTRTAESDATVKELKEKIQQMEKGELSSKKTGQGESTENSKPESPPSSIPAIADKTPARPATGSPSSPPVSSQSLRRTFRNWTTCDGKNHLVEDGVPTSLYCSRCKSSAVVNN